VNPTAKFTLAPTVHSSRCPLVRRERDRVLWGLGAGAGRRRRQAARVVKHWRARPGQLGCSSSCAAAAHGPSGKSWSPRPPTPMMVGNLNPACFFCASYITVIPCSCALHWRSWIPLSSCALFTVWPVVATWVGCIINNSSSPYCSALVTWTPCRWVSRSRLFFDLISVDLPSPISLLLSCVLVPLACRNWGYHIWLWDKSL
jgi:hypothetical protein